MTDDEQMIAWNNLVGNADHSKYAKGDKKRAAAIVSYYMGNAGHGGLNSFLTYSYDLDTHEVLTSLEALGASIAAAELRTVVSTLGDPLVASTQDVRWDKLDTLWIDELDKIDYLSEDADQDLIDALTRHIKEFSEFYLSMPAAQVFKKRRWWNWL